MFGQNVYKKFTSSIQDTEILYRLTHKDIVLTLEDLRVFKFLIDNF